MRLLLLIILVSFCGTSKSQQLLFENYSSEQGLSQNSCYSIAQDADGFMWFGTQDGLNRYDGKHFKVFLPQNEIGRKLPANYISSLFFDEPKNLLWIGTIRGLCIYDPSIDSLVSITERYPFAANLEKLPVKKIVSYKPNEYWIISFNNGLQLVNTATKTITSFFEDEVNKNTVSSIVLHRGKILVGLSNRLVYLHPNGESYQMKPFLEGQDFPEIKELFSYNDALWVGTTTKGCFYITPSMEASSNIQPFPITTGGIGCFAKDGSGKLWIGTRGNGIIQYDPETRLVQLAANNKYNNRSLGKNFVLSIFKDRQGIVWCGLSGSGVAKYDPLKYQFNAISNEPLNETSLPDDMIFKIFKSGDGTHYVGTQNKGIAQWNVTSNNFTTFAASSKINQVSNTIYDITEHKNNLWIASWGGLIQLNRQTKNISYKEDNNLLASKKLYGITKLKNADSLFITGENGTAFFSLTKQEWNSFDDKLGWTKAYVGRYIYEGSNSNLWICTVGAGLVKYNYKENSFKIIEPVKKISIYVRHLLQQGDIFWLATDNGIVLYDYLKEKVVKHFKLSTPDQSNVCYAIVKDNMGFIWVSTNTGLYRVHPNDFSIQHYNLGNGLSFLEYNTACALQEGDGSLLFGGVGGITRFNPALLKKNTFSPNPIVTAINVNDSAWQLTKELNLNHTQNFITIYFAVNNFSNQNNNQFFYRLKGLNENWTNAGNSGFANYTSLPPANYVFELRSANSDGKWCEGTTTLSFSIHPPWWQTWWFRILAFMLSAGIVTYFVRRRIAMVGKEANLKQKIAETEMKALRAQMNPHFIFNSLNSIREMILNNENREASHFLSKFAHLIRITLDQTGQSFISLRNTIDYLQRYVEMEQVRNAEFTCRILADDELDLDETELPPMLIQPFVENAIWHGVTSNEKNINITIDFKKENEQLACIISDNGIGINQSMKNKIGSGELHHSVGIENIQNRLKLLDEKHALKSSLIIQDKATLEKTDEHGTIVTLRIPLEINQS